MNSRYESALPVLRLVFIVLACFCAYFLFRATGDPDIKPWLAVGVVVGIIGALFPWSGS